MDMSNINLEVKTHHDPEQLFKKVSRMLETSAELRAFDPNYSYELNPAQLSAFISGKQFKVEMKVSKEDEGSCAKIAVILPRHLSFLKGVIEKKLKTQLENQLQGISL